MCAKAMRPKTRRKMGRRKHHSSPVFYVASSFSFAFQVVNHHSIKSFCLQFTDRLKPQTTTTTTVIVIVTTTTTTTSTASGGVDGEREEGDTMIYLG